MFETLSHLALQEYWWVIISILGATLVFLLFVQGGQTMISCLGKTEVERTMIVNSFIPAFLQYQFWWCLLGLDDNSFCVHHSGCVL